MKPTLTLLTTLLRLPLAALHAADRTLSAVQHLVRSATWTGKWPDKAGHLQTLTVTAEVWTAAFQADLDVDGKLHIPARDNPCLAFIEPDGTVRPGHEVYNEFC